MSARRWLLGAAMLGVTACADLFAPPLRFAALQIVPVFGEAEAAADADRLRIVVERDSAGTFTTAVDTTVTIDPATGEASANVKVVLLQSPQQFRVTLLGIRSGDGAVLYQGVDTVEVRQSSGEQQPEPLPVTLAYAGPAAARVELAPADTAVREGTSFAFRAAVFDTANQQISAPVGFALAEPADSTLLAVHRLRGEAQARAASLKTVLVVVSTRDSPPKRDTARVRVCSPSVVGPVEVLDVSPDQHTFVLLGEQLQLQVTGFDACNNAIAGPAVTWSSSDRAVVPVDTLGIARGRDNGVAVITATLQANASVTASTGELVVAIPAGNLRGLVRRQEDSQPVSGVELVLTDVFGRARTATTGADGTYLFSGVPAGPDYVLSVSPATLPPITVIATEDPRTVTVTGDATVDVAETVIRRARIPLFAELSTDSLDAGGETEVTLVVDMTEVRPPLGAVTVQLVWSASVLRYVAGSFAPVAAWDAAIENASVAGELVVSAVSSQGIGDDSVRVARFRLRASATGSTTVTPNPIELSSIDSEGVAFDLLKLGEVVPTGSRVTVQAGGG